MQTVSIVAGGTLGGSNLPMAHFGEALIKLRTQRRMTQDDLVASSGLSRSLIQAAEKARIPKMRPKNYKRLAAGLGMEPEELDVAWGQPAASGPGPRMISMEPAKYAGLLESLLPNAMFGLDKWMDRFADYMIAHPAQARRLADDVDAFASGAKPHRPGHFPTLAATTRGGPKEK